jgi:hypothetical protein
MTKLDAYRIRFLNADGLLIEDRTVSAESASAAIERAWEISAEIGAADFSIVLLPPKLGESER